MSVHPTQVFLTNFDDADNHFWSKEVGTSVLKNGLAKRLCFDNKTTFFTGPPLENFP